MKAAKDPGLWRFVALAKKGAQESSPSELSMAALGAASDEEAARGVRLLAEAWGEATLARKMAQPMGLGLLRHGDAALSHIGVLASLMRNPPERGMRESLGLLLEMGADPDVGREDFRPVECAIANASWDPAGQGWPKEYMMAMLARSKLPADPIWVDRAIARWPEQSSPIRAEQAKRERLALRGSTPSPEVTATHRPRL